MESLVVKARHREIGKSTARSLRRSGGVPGIFYLAGEESLPVTVDALELRPLVYTAETQIVNLEIEGEKEAKPCILKDIEFDPITDNIVHFDLQGVTAGKPITVEVPIMLKGTAKGEITGGVVQQVLHRVQIECLPKYLPESIEVNIEALSIGQNIRINEITLENIRILENEDSVVVAVTVPRVAKVSDEEAATEEATEGGEAQEGG